MSSSLFIIKPIKTLTLAALGLLLRVLLITNFKETLKQRVEVTTPIGNWKRAYEAVHLWDSGLDPYSGNIFHEYPISLQFYKILISYFNIDLAFAGTDVITAILLQHSVFQQLIQTGQTKEVAASRSMKVLLIYLFSPITLISCAGTSTSIFTNFLIAAICFILPMKPFRALTCVLSAFLACNNIHYATLILPIFLCLEYCSKQNKRQRSSSSSKPYYQHHEFRASLTASILICLATLVTLISASYFLMGGSWTFVKASYIFVLKVQDLTPNIGMFWYLFTEVFDHFLSFFTWIAQINAFIHAVPLSICLRDNPFFALYVMILTSTIFQPYPSLANVGILTSLLPQWLELFPHMNRGLIVCCAGVACMSLWPIFWHLWIIAGTANSNFYFGATLAFTASLILFMIDLLNAYGYLRAKAKIELYQKESRARESTIIEEDEAEVEEETKSKQKSS